MRCRPAEPSDRAAVHRLACAFDGTTAEPADEAFDARFRRILSRDDWALLVADDGERIVGYALVQDYGPGLRRDFSTGRMHDLFVDVDHRRRGVGAGLVRAVVEWCESRPRPMILDWSSRPDSVAFYTSLGLEADTVGDNAQYPAYCIDFRDPDGARPVA